VTEIRFYHLERSTLESALPTMLERVIERGQRALVVLGSKERLDALNMHLWTYRAEKFLPHGLAEDGFAEHQPVFLGLDDANPNKAEVLFVADGAVGSDLARFQLCVELFDGSDESAVAAARRRWRDYKAAGHALTYWRQTDQGWKQEAAG
jgi:DNA polymerase III subunit chi